MASVSDCVPFRNETNNDLPVTAVIDMMYTKMVNIRKSDRLKGKIYYDRI